MQIDQLKSNAQEQGVPRRRLRGLLSLRFKATALALALGTLPVLAVGATAYYFANQSIVKQIKQEQQNRAIGIANAVNRFMPVNI